MEKEKKTPAKKVSEASVIKKVSAPQKASSVEKTSATITVKMIGSPIRRDARQREYLKGLGLRKIGAERTLLDTPSVRGLVKKAQHMVRVVV